MCVPFYVTTVPSPAQVIWVRNGLLFIAFIAVDYLILGLFLLSYIFKDLVLIRRFT